MAARKPEAKAEQAAKPARKRDSRHDRIPSPNGPKRKHVPGRRPGRPPFVPTPEQRIIAAIGGAHGTPRDIIADSMGITLEILGKYFRKELTEGLPMIRDRMVKRTVRNALAGDSAMLRYWLICHGGPEWQPTKKTLIGGFDGALPIPISGGAQVVVVLPDNGRVSLPPAHA
jgi:hypothetical protein